MPLLAYCMMEAAVAVEKPAAGVAEKTIEDVEDSGLRCFFSRFETDQLSRIPSVDSIVAFHQVQQALLGQGAVIPFRFPTFLPTEEKLLRYLRECASAYTAELSRLRDMVQMEIQIRRHAPVSGSRVASGREYLQERQKEEADMNEAAERFRQVSGSWVREWRERHSAAGIRCYALVHREAVAGFQEAAQATSQCLPGTRLSGPWPPAEFLKVKDFNG